MNPFYFGPSGKRLFGVYHPPGSAKARKEHLARHGEEGAPRIGSRSEGTLGRPTS